MIHLHYYGHEDLVGFELDMYSWDLQNKSYCLVFVNKNDRRAAHSMFSSIGVFDKLAVAELAMCV